MTPFQADDICWLVIAYGERPVMLKVRVLAAQQHMQVRTTIGLVHAGELFREERRAEAVLRGILNAEVDMAEAKLAEARERLKMPIALCDTTGGA